MNPFDERAKVETIRWKGEPSRRAEERRFVAEGGWLAVVLPTEIEKAYVETIERASVERSFCMTYGGRNGPTYYVSAFRIDSSVGIVSWEARFGKTLMPVHGGGVSTSPVWSGLDGDLRLPDGSVWPTTKGSGFFDAPGLVRAYRAWRDADVDRGWTLVTEVHRSVPEELRPLLAAVPLLLFTSLLIG